MKKLIKIVLIITLFISHQLTTSGYSSFLSENHPLAEKVNLLNSEIKILKEALTNAIENSSLSEQGLIQVQHKLDEVIAYKAFITTKEGAALFEQRCNIEKLAGFEYPNNNKSIEQILLEYKPTRSTETYNDLQYQLLQKQAAIEKDYFKGDRTNLDQLMGEVKTLQDQLNTYINKNGIAKSDAKQGLVLIQNDNGLPPYWFTGEPGIDKKNYENAKKLSQN